MCSCTKCCSFMAACSTSCVAHVLFYFCSSAAHVFVMCVHVPSACTSCVALVCFLTTLPTTWGPYSELCILCHAPSRSGWTMARAAASRRCSPPPRAAARWTPTAAAEAAGSGKRLAATPREARVLAKPALGGAAEWQELGRGLGGGTYCKSHSPLWSLVNFIGSTHELASWTLQSARSSEDT